MEENKKVYFKTSCSKSLACKMDQENKEKGEPVDNFFERLQEVLQEVEKEEMLQPTAWRYG